MRTPCLMRSKVAVVSGSGALRGLSRSRQATRRRLPSKTTYLPSSWRIAHDSVGLSPCSAMLLARLTILDLNSFSSLPMASSSVSTAGRPRRGFRRSRWRRLMDRFLCPIVTTMGAFPT